ncbi:MAG TPA: metallophosphoesterase [Vicinamibacteria bacterium]|nr:metallophosphoesterase [Vicinamibacteria bacterium]
MFRLAHVSDTHVMAPEGVHWRELFFNKRIAGWANTRLRRGRVYRHRYLEAVLEAASRADHLVVTGDVTNLALEGEYREARRLFEARAGALEISIVPGNHDLYLPSISREGRFARHFGSFARSDLPEVRVGVAAGAFPFIKLRGPVAIIGLSSAVPRPPFVAAGYLGQAQLRALTAILEHPEVARRVPVVLVHHPPVDRRPRLLRWRDGLADAASLRQVLATAGRGLVLFGHLHSRVRCRLGALDVVCASGAALDHPDDAVRAGYNLYEIDEGGVGRMEAQVVDPAGSGLRRVDIPVRPDCV